MKLYAAYKEENAGVDFRYCTGDGKLFNLQHLQAVTKISFYEECEGFVCLFFADDCCTLNATTPPGIQRSLAQCQFPSACNNFSLKINTEEIVVMYQSAPDVPLRNQF